MGIIIRLYNSSLEMSYISYQNKKFLFTCVYKGSFTPSIYGYIIIKDI